MRYSKNAARPKNSRDHGTMAGGTRRSPRRDYLVPLRKKHPWRRYMVPDPVRRPKAVRVARRKRDRARKIAKTAERILDVFDGKGMRGVAFRDQIVAILEEVL